MSQTRLLLVCWLLTTAEGERRGWAPAGPLGRACPCGASADVAAWAQAGAPAPHTQQYYVHVARALPANSVTRLTFDEEANVKFSVKSTDGKFSQVSLGEGDVFTLRFAEPQPSLALAVRGLAPGVLPHLMSLTIDDVEHCAEPDVNSLQNYLDTGTQLKTGEYQWSAESSKSRKAQLRHCGRRNVASELTVDGDAEPGAWPWFAAVYQRSEGALRYRCAGTLISANSVLTTSQCVSEPLTYLVFVGRYELENWAEDFIGRNVDKIITPPTNDSGIAILKLNKDVPFTDSVRPACLWNSEVHGAPDEGSGTIVGWGYDDNDKLLDFLQQANMPLVRRDTCLRADPSLSVWLSSPDRFCAGFHEYGTAACDGDSGIAFMVFVPDAGQPSGSWHVRGILQRSASGPGDALCGHGYAVFADVDKHRGWIAAHLLD